MNNHHEVGHFRNRLMIVLLSLFVFVVTAGQSFAATDCSTCHGMPPLDSAERSPSTGAFKGNHQKHMGATASPAECTKCHGNSGYADDHADSSGYMIQMNSNINAHPTGATYSKPASFPQTATPTLGSCSNVNCHFEKNTTDRTPAPVWGTTAGVTCSSCHDAVPSDGNHTKHLASSAGGATLTCASCHPNYGTSNFSHATSAGKHPIVVNTNHNYGGAGVTNISWLPSQPDTYGSCSTYCHSNGSGQAGNTATTWGTTNTTGCAFCHPNLSTKHSSHVNLLNLVTATYGSTSDNSAGTIYDFGCGNCHPTSISSHLNNSIDLTLNSTHGGQLKSKNNVVNDTSGYTQTTNVSVTCAASYCHSNGMATPTFYGNTFDWFEGVYAGDKCARCHGNSPSTGGRVGSTAHTAHLVGIHYENIYSGVTGNLPPGGAANINAGHGANHRSTTINCNICHADTVTTSANDNNEICAGCHNGETAPYKNPVLSPSGLISNTAKHVNGSVDVVFVDQTIATKAQVAASAFAAYTANTSGWVRNSNGMPYKTYTSSYDYTKSTLFAAATPYSTANGCLNIACHSSIQVKWTDTISCNNCHARLR